MKIYSPTKLCFITQGFGTKNTSPSMMEKYNAIGLSGGHNGIDFGLRCKDHQVIHGGQCESVYMNVAGADLTVISYQKDDKGGFGINAQDEKGNRYCWWHFDIINPEIQVGTKLTFGQELGVGGNTGMSTGAHCHFGLYLKDENKNNGYGGASNPEPYFDGRFCGDIATQITLIQKLLEIYKSILNLWKK